MARRGRGRIGPDARGAFLQTHTPHAALRIARQEAGLQYNPVIHQARAQAAGSRVRQGQLQDWYNQLASDFASSAQNAQQAYQNAEAATNQRLADAAQRGQAAQQQAAASDASFAKLVGGSTAPAQRATEQAAQGSLEQQRVNLQEPVTAQRAAYASFLGTKPATARLAGIQAVREEQRRRGKILSDINTAQRERGAATAVDLEKLREADRNYGVQRAAFGLKRVEAALGTRQAQERIAIDRRNAASRERSQRATEKHYTHGSGLTAHERQKVRNERQSALALARTAIRAVGVPKSPKGWAELEAAVVEKHGNAAFTRQAIAALRKQIEARRAQREKIEAAQRKKIVGTVLHPGTTE